MKPKCQFKDCNNNAENSGHGHYKKWCTSHKRKMYNMPLNKEGRNEARKMKRGECVMCHWKGPCHIHRIIPGAVGGKYIKGNVIELCPSCHSIQHKLISPLIRQNTLFI